MENEELIKAVFQRVAGDDVKLLRVYLEEGRPEIISFEFEAPKVAKGNVVGVDMSKGRKPVPILAAIEAGEAAADWAQWKIREAKKHGSGSAT